MTQNMKISAPVGMSGLAVEPWAKGEIYAVAANWAQAGSPVLSYGGGGWDLESHGRQVADFRHSARAALESVIRAAIKAGGDEPDDDEVEAILDDAEELRDADVAEMADMLERHGDRFTGSDADDMAQEWMDQGFNAADAGEWCEIGVWEPATAAAFRDARKTPAEIRAAAEQLIEDAGANAADEYTDGDPIYSACNGDTRADEIIEAVQD